jgi:hypothetical protein
MYCHLLLQPPDNSNNVLKELRLKQEWELGSRMSISSTVLAHFWQTMSAFLQVNQFKIELKICSEKYSRSQWKYPPFARIFNQGQLAHLIAIIES